jgi:hypothetical protein
MSIVIKSGVVHAHISGGTLIVEVPTVIRTGSMHKDLTGISGGVELSSGVVKSVILKCANDNSGFVLIGGSGAGQNPYSGYGLALERGDGVGLDISNFNEIYVMSTVSGFDDLTFAGVT